VDKPPYTVPIARHWRDIPQPIKPRTMSRGGRWRLVWASLRILGGGVFVGGLAWGGWMIVGAMAESPRVVPASARAVPMRAPELRTDGVLPPLWVSTVLAVRPNASLMELDLDQLRRRLLSEPQVLTATLTRNFPDRLIVTLTERTPVARVMAEVDGEVRALLVAKDGVMFAGEGHDPIAVAALPLIEGAALRKLGDSYLPIEGMSAAAELLMRAQLEAEHLYRTWRSVSVARLASDRELEVRTISGLTVVFNANTDYFRQLAKLDYLWEKIAGVPVVQARIDLSLGREVPVYLEVAPPNGVEPAKAANAKTPAKAPSRSEKPSFMSSPGSTKGKREL
jgi:cell division protein FtsQ